MKHVSAFSALPAVALLALALLGAPSAFAQTPPPNTAPARQAAPTPPEWDKLTPAQREALIAVVRERWNSEPGQRARMLQHAERWRTMTPEQRRSAQHGQQRWSRMSQAEQREHRALYEYARRLSPEQRAALREKLKTMTPEQRRAWIQEQRERMRNRPRQGADSQP
jgi:hypothetical protein